MGERREMYTSGARGAVARLLFGAALGLAVAEVLVRTTGLAPAEIPPPVALEGPGKRFALDCYPEGRADPPDVDLRGANPDRLADLAARLGVGPGRLAEVAAVTPLCVESQYNDRTRRDGPFAPSDEPTVLVVGDSFAEGQGVRRDLTFPVRLGALTGRRVYNGARRGQDLPDQLETLRALLPATRPGVIVYAMTLNDFEQDPAWAARQAYLNDLVLDRQRTGPPRRGRLALPRLLRQRLADGRATRDTLAWYRGMTGPGNAGGWARTRADLAAMRDLSRDAGAELVVAILPMLVGLRGDGEGYPLRGLHDDITAACSDLDLRCVDLLPALTGPPAEALWVHRVDMHPNADAHRRIAEALAGALP